MSAFIARIDIAGPSRVGVELGGAGRGIMSDQFSRTGQLRIGAVGAGCFGDLKGSSGFLQPSRSLEATYSQSICGLIGPLLDTNMFRTPCPVNVTRLNMLRTKLLHMLHGPKPFSLDQLSPNIVRTP